MQRAIAESEAKLKELQERKRLQQQERPQAATQAAAVNSTHQQGNTVMDNEKKYGLQCREHQPEALANAVRSHVYGRQLGGYKPLMDSYFKATTPALNTLARAGYQTKIDQSTKASLVNIEVKTAARLGLI
jgi:hypothetical protein